MFMYVFSFNLSIAQVFRSKDFTGASSDGEVKSQNLL